MSHDISLPRAESKGEKIEEKKKSDGMKKRNVYVTSPRTRILHMQQMLIVRASDIHMCVCVCVCVQILYTKVLM